jgi:hypothetical protein
MHRSRFGVEPFLPGLWACRRPRATSTRPARAAGARSRTSGCWGASASCARPTLTPTGHGACAKALTRAGETVGRGRVERSMRAHASRAPSAATSPSAPRPIRSPSAPRTWCSVTPAPARQTASGWATSRTCAAGRAWSPSRSSSMPTAAASSAGSSPATCAQSWSWTRWRSPSINAAQLPLTSS